MNIHIKIMSRIQKIAEFNSLHVFYICLGIRDYRFF
jgi:hypothetical protein